MKNIWKYSIIGIIVVLAEWLFVALCESFFDGSSMEVATIIGVGFFLAFELVICTGLIISRLNKDRD